MNAEEFEKKFDEGQEEIIDDLDLTTARRVNQEQKRINVDFPAWVVAALDREAGRIGVTRQSIIKVWLVERLKAEVGSVTRISMGDVSLPPKDSPETGVSRQ